MPLTLAQANDLVRDLHRHHKPVIGHRFSLGVEANGKLAGAVIVGRPKSRHHDQYETAEVTRLVTDGTKNACSILYAAAARVARLGQTHGNREDQPTGPKQRWAKALATPPSQGRAGGAAAERRARISHRHWADS